MKRLRHIDVAPRLIQFGWVRTHRNQPARARRSTKHQTPSSSETSSTKHQSPPAGYYARYETKSSGGQALTLIEGVKSGKIQDPRSNETLSSKSQLAPNVSLRYSDDAGPVGKSVFVLKDEPLPPSTSKHPFDLEERTAIFGEAIVRFSKKIPRDPTNDRLINQLVGSATSVGANYCEANEGVSKKDFRHPISRCIKEAKETRFFLRMVVASEPQLAEEARALYREANELMLIFAQIYRKCTGNA
jgi:four helix bundle protein